MTEDNKLTKILTKIKIKEPNSQKTPQNHLRQ